MIGGALLAGVAGSLCAGLSTRSRCCSCSRGSPASARPRCSSPRPRSIADLSPPDRRAEAASYFSVAVFGGLGIGPIIGEAVLQRRPLRAGVPRRRRRSRCRRRDVARSCPSRVDRRVRRRRPEHAAIVPRRRRVRPPRRARARPRAGLRHRRVRRVLGVPPRVRPIGRPRRLRRPVRRLQRRLPRAAPRRRPPARALGARRAVTTASCSSRASLLLLAAVPGSRGRCGSSAALVGVGMAFMYPSLMALTVNRVDERERAVAIELVHDVLRGRHRRRRLALGAVAELFGKRVGFAGGRRCCARSACGCCGARSSPAAAPPVEPRPRPASTSPSPPTDAPPVRRLGRRSSDVRFPLSRRSRHRP